LLHLALTVRSQPGKLLPGSVIVQCMLEHAGGLMFDVLDGRRLGMRLTKRRDASVYIRTLIAHNLARHARFRHGVWQLRKDNGPVGWRDRRHGQRFDILLAQTMVSIRSRTEANADNHEAFLLTNLDCMIHNPHPIVSLCLGPTELVIAQPQQPQTAARP
jgi:hypothetical protein